MRNLLLKLPMEPEHLARAVSTVPGTYITAGELKDGEQILPKGLRALWSEAVRS